MPVAAIGTTVLAFPDVALATDLTSIELVLHGLPINSLAH